MLSRWTTAAVRCVLTMLVVAPAGPACAEGSRRRPLTPRDADAVERARHGAAARLADGECRKVFSDFQDVQGRTIASKLEEWAVDPAGFLRVMPFLVGSGEALCDRSKVMLVSSPNVPRVIVCSGFARLQRDQPAAAESLVIHELLHTLGLGENPPASAAITARVEARCR